MFSININKVTVSNMYSIVFLVISEAFNDQCSHHIESSQFICSENQMTGFYMMETSVVKELSIYALRSFLRIIFKKIERCLKNVRICIKLTIAFVGSISEFDSKLPFPQSTRTPRRTTRTTLAFLSQYVTERNVTLR